VCKIARRTLKPVYDIFSLVVIDLIIRLGRVYLFSTPLANDLYLLFLLSLLSHIQMPPQFSRPSTKPITSTNMLVIDIVVPPLTILFTPLPPLRESY